MKTIKYFYIPALFLLLSCKKQRPDFPLAAEGSAYILTTECQLKFSVPKSYNQTTGSYLLEEGEILFNAQSCEKQEVLFSTHYIVSSGSIPNVIINGNQKGIAFFKCTTDQLLKDALVKFPFQSVSMFNSIQQYKPYRIKIDNTGKMLESLNDPNKWEELTIVKIDSTKRQVHFHSKSFNNYVYCIAKR